MSELLPAENPIIELDSAVFSLSGDTIKISDISSISDDQLLDDVFGDCEDLLKDTRVEDAFPELSETVTPSMSVTAADEEQKAELKVEEDISQTEKVAVEASLQKSVSSGSLTSMDCVNGGETRTSPRFLGMPGMDLGAVFGMRRAYSEGDIQVGKWLLIFIPLIFIIPKICDLVNLLTDSDEPLEYEPSSLFL